MKIKKYSSNYEIIDSGMLITYNGSSEVKIAIECDENFTFNLKFDFEKSEDYKEHSLKLKIVENNTIVFLCTNFDNALGTGTNTPIELATVNNKKIYINFWIYSLGQNAMKKIDYALYIEN